MKTNSISNKLKTVGFGMILAGGIAFASGVNVSAQTPPPPDAPMPNPNMANDKVGDDWLRLAREQGMRDGLTRGTNDRTLNRSFKPEKAGDYKKATAGYLSSYGNRQDYRTSYRQAFLAGYDRGYKGMSDGDKSAKPPMNAGPAPLAADKPAPPVGKRRSPRRGERPVPRPEDKSALPSPVAGNPEPPKDNAERPAPPAAERPAPPPGSETAPRPDDKPAPRPADKPAAKPDDRPLLPTDSPKPPRR